MMNARIHFKNDYMDGAHPKVMSKLIETNSLKTPGYSEDEYCEYAREYIKKAIKDSFDKCETSLEDVLVEFFPSGTITNLTLISAALRPHECVIAAKDSHINVHEAGAIEARGHKVVTTPDENGILTIEALQNVYDFHTSGGYGGIWHMVKPGMVYYSNSTEDGYVYTLKKIKEIYNWAHERDLFVYIDGARLGSAIKSTSSDVTLGDIFNYSDAFSIGGTKNGALFGEVLVLSNQKLKRDFRYVMKQCGAVMPKGRLLGVQFMTLFEPKKNDDCLYYKIAAHQNAMAQKLRSVLADNGFLIEDNGLTNQIFIETDERTARLLVRLFDADICGYGLNGQVKLRFATSWSTTEKDIATVNEILNSSTMKKFLDEGK